MTVPGRAQAPSPSARLPANSTAAGEPRGAIKGRSSRLGSARGLESRKLHFSVGVGPTISDSAVAASLSDPKRAGPSTCIRRPGNAAPTGKAAPSQDSAPGSLPASQMAALTLSAGEMVVGGDSRRWADVVGASAPAASTLAPMRPSCEELHEQAAADHPELAAGVEAGDLLAVQSLRRFAARRRHPRGYLSPQPSFSPSSAFLDADFGSPTLLAASFRDLRVVPSPPGGDAPDGDASAPIVLAAHAALPSAQASPSAGVAAPSESSPVVLAEAPGAQCDGPASPRASLFGTPFVLAESVFPPNNAILLAALPLGSAASRATREADSVALGVGHSTSVAPALATVVLATSESAETAPICLATLEQARKDAMESHGARCDQCGGLSHPSAPDSCTRRVCTIHGRDWSRLCSGSAVCVGRRDAELARVIATALNSDVPPRCDRCGTPRAEGDHASCGPRNCDECGTYWTANCSLSSACIAKLTRALDAEADSRGWTVVGGRAGQPATLVGAGLLERLRVVRVSGRLNQCVKTCFAAYQGYQSLLVTDGQLRRKGLIDGEGLSPTPLEPARVAAALGLRVLEIQVQLTVAGAVRGVIEELRRRDVFDHVIAADALIEALGDRSIPAAEAALLAASMVIGLVDAVEDDLSSTDLVVRRLVEMKFVASGAPDIGTLVEVALRNARNPETSPLCPTVPSVEQAFAFLHDGDQGEAVDAVSCASRLSVQGDLYRDCAEGRMAILVSSGSQAHFDVAAPAPCSSLIRDLVSSVAAIEADANERADAAARAVAASLGTQLPVQGGERPTPQQSGAAVGGAAAAVVSPTPPLPPQVPPSASLPPPPPVLSPGAAAAPSMVGAAALMARLAAGTSRSLATSSVAMSSPGPSPLAAGGPTCTPLKASIGAPPVSSATSSSSSSSARSPASPVPFSPSFLSPTSPPSSVGGETIVPAPSPSPVAAALAISPATSNARISAEIDDLLSRTAKLAAAHGELWRLVEGQIAAYRDGVYGGVPASSLPDVTLMPLGPPPTRVCNEELDRAQCKEWTARTVAELVHDECVDAQGKEAVLLKPRLHFAQARAKELRADLDRIRGELGEAVAASARRWGRPGDGAAAMCDRVVAVDIAEGAVANAIASSAAAAATAFDADATVTAHDVRQAVKRANEIIQRASGQRTVAEVMEATQRLCVASGLSQAASDRARAGAGQTASGGSLVPRVSPRPPPRLPERRR